jgi:hypothetical protein
MRRLARVDRPRNLAQAGGAREHALEVETVGELVGAGLAEHPAIQPATSARKWSV